MATTARPCIALRGVREFAHRFGGSHAQRDLLDLTLIEAALRSGQAALAKALCAVDLQSRFVAMADHADAILAAVARQGYEPCTYTEEHLRGLRG